MTKNRIKGRMRLSFPVEIDDALLEGALGVREIASREDLATLLVERAEEGISPLYEAGRLRVQSREREEMRAKLDAAEKAAADLRAKLEEHEEDEG